MKKQKQRKKPINLEKAGDFLRSVGGAVTAIVKTHPASLGLSLMAASALTLIVARKKEAEGSQWGKYIAAEANGLYQGAQAITVVMAAVPIITAAAGAATSVAGSLYGVKTPVEEGPATK